MEAYVVVERAGNQTNIVSAHHTYEGAYEVWDKLRREIIRLEKLDLDELEAATPETINTYPNAYPEIRTYSVLS